MGKCSPVLLGAKIQSLSQELRGQGPAILPPPQHAPSSLGPRAAARGQGPCPGTGLALSLQAGSISQSAPLAEGRRPIPTPAWNILVTAASPLAPQGAFVRGDRQRSLTSWHQNSS